MDLTANKTITITFGDQAENHNGMNRIGVLSNEGFTLKDLRKAKKRFEKVGVGCEYIRLDNLNFIEEKYQDIEFNEAAILIIRNGCEKLLDGWYANSDDLFAEQLELEWDTKAKMRGRVVNKHARHNLCYGEVYQEPNYEHGDGRIIPFESIPCTNFIRENLQEWFGKKAEGLVAEGNLYHDVKKCGVSMHGDAERMKVIAIRLGETIPLCYRWYLNTKPISEIMEFELHHGDVYIMSEFATGNNWRKRLVPTLRHAAGCKKYTHSS